MRLELVLANGEVAPNLENVRSFYTSKVETQSNGRTFMTVEVASHDIQSDGSHLQTIECVTWIRSSDDSKGPLDPPS